MRTRARTYIRFLISFGIIGTLGIGASLYLLVKQRLSLPFQNEYALSAAFDEAPGVHSGLGQPVNVAGVTVGQVSGVQIRDGLAIVHMEIQRNQLPHVYADATAAIEPITPLNDMQIELNPGQPPSRPLPSGATLPVAATTSPVELTDLLNSLDGDTRDALVSLITSLHDGLSGRAPDFRRLLLALGPMTSQVGEISRALQARNEAVSRLVHNLALVTRAASRDGQLENVVRASDTTLAAMGSQQAALESSFSQLPPTLAVARSTFVHLTPFAGKLRSALTALEPSVQRFPKLFAALKPFAQLTTAALRDKIRPLVRAAQPVASDLGAATPLLSKSTPGLSRTMQVLLYLVNELAYNPGGDDPGMLFWTAWFDHNINSDGGSGDAHGPVGRATFIVTCQGVQGMPYLQEEFNISGLCPH